MGENRVGDNAQIKDPAEAGSTNQKGAGGLLTQEAKRHHNRLHQDAHVEAN